MIPHLAYMRFRGFSFCCLFLLAIYLPLIFKHASAQATGCQSSSNSTYTVTVCITQPGNGATIQGVQSVTATVNIVGANSGLLELYYYLGGKYLINDRAAPYLFSLPSDHFVDGAYTLAVEARMKDGFVSQRASIDVTLQNGVTSPPVNTRTFQPTVGSGAITVAAVGDGAGSYPDTNTASSFILSKAPDFLLYLGDVYEKGSYTEFYNWYGTPDRNYGRMAAITNPTVGNHEYATTGAAGYFFYWDNVPHYYSYNSGGWHIISLDLTEFYQSAPGTAQYNWLVQDLNNNTLPCVMAYFHHPRYSVGPQGDTARVAPVWSLLAEKGVTVALAGHDHSYQRWQALDGSGTPSAQGITQFVVGTGGHGLQGPARSDARLVTFSTVLGALFMDLFADHMDFRFVNVANQVVDSGQINCTNTDRTPPTAPGSLSAIAVSATLVDLTWSAATDSGGIASYTILRDGSELQSVAGETLSFADTTVEGNRSYSYSVVATDNAGNRSTPSNEATVTTPAPPSGVFTFAAMADGYVLATQPSTNFGGLSVIRVDSDPDMRTYLRFDVQGLSGAVVDASLQIYANSGSNSGYHVRGVADNSWSETGLNYNNAPALGALAASSGPVTIRSWTTVNVTSQVAGDGPVNLALTGASATAIAMSSREGANPPLLVITVGAANTTDRTPPTAPGSLSAIAVSATLVDLTWSAATDSGGIASYTILRDGSELQSVAGETLSFADTTVEGNRSYSYSVVATDNAGNRSTPSNEATVTTPAPPSGVFTFAAMADGYVLATQPSTNFGGLSVIRVDSDPDMRTYLRFDVQGLSGAVVDASLQIYANSGSNSGYHVRGVADNSWSETGLNYNNAPALGALAASSGPVTIRSWTTVNVTSQVTGDGPVNLALTGASATAIAMSSREGANPPLLVITVGAANTTDRTPPTAPGSLSAIAVSATLVDLTWSAATDSGGIASYTILRDGSELQSVAGETLSFADTTVEGNRSYSYSVVATDNAGNRSTPSNEATVTTPAPPSGVFTFAAMADGYVLATQPSTNFGGLSVIRVDSDPDMRTYLRFDVQGLSGAVVDASLQIYANSGSNSGYHVRGVADNSWSETGLNYNNAPALGALAASSGPVTIRSWTTVNVTSQVAGNGPVNLALTGASATAIAMSSREGANPPLLVITVGAAGATAARAAALPSIETEELIEQAIDSDGDGLSDEDEFSNGADPNLADSDSDGMPDLWEVESGLDPRTSSGNDGAQGDPDNDGIVNLDEYNGQTDPFAPDNSLPVEMTPRLYLPWISLR